ncbi:hypothetical protein PHOSAC3_120748 [Mesotoga infera]|nr:hypothetical protein PHOSAC3_120748 [Mesotoga infera]
MKPWIDSKSSHHILANKIGLFERCVALTKLAQTLPVQKIIMPLLRRQT